MIRAATYLSVPIAIANLFLVANIWTQSQVSLIMYLAQNNMLEQTRCAPLLFVPEFIVFVHFWTIAYLSLSSRHQKRLAQNSQIMKSRFVAETIVTIIIALQFAIS